jgi:hypothetical protein
MLFKNWLFISKQITLLDPNNECPIKMEPIKINEWYCKCNQCNYNISFDSYYQMVSNNTFIISCPICRKNWTNYIIYLNNNNNKIFVLLRTILKSKLKINRKKNKIIKYFENKIDCISNYFDPPYRATNGYIQVQYGMNEYAMDNNDLYSLNNLPNNLPDNIINEEEKMFWFYVFIFYLIIIFIMYFLI